MTFSPLPFRAVVGGRHVRPASNEETPKLWGCITRGVRRSRAAHRPSVGKAATQPAHLSSLLVLAHPMRWHTGHGTLATASCEEMVAIMRAHLGDQLVVESQATGAARRDGEIVGLHREDGTPPYDVRWSDTGEVTLVFPGSDAHVRHLGHEAGGLHTPARPGMDEAGAVPTVTAVPGEVGRRVAAERRRQGLSHEELAETAGMSPDHLASLEKRPTDPSLATLIRLAGALGTTVASLRGVGVEAPPGQGQVLLHPELRALSPDECRIRLSTHGVGRVAVSTPDGPAIIPVNYEVADDAIAFRTAPGSAPAAAVGTDVAFEVDHVDKTMSQGWSVLAVGPASVVSEPDAVRRLAERAHTKPWAGGQREMWVSIRPTRLTGRRIGSAGQ